MVAWGPSSHVFPRPSEAHPRFALPPPPVLGAGGPTHDVQITSTRLERGPRTAERPSDRGEDPMGPATWRGHAHEKNPAMRGPARRGHHSQGLDAHLEPIADRNCERCGATSQVQYFLKKRDPPRSAIRAHL